MHQFLAWFNQPGSLNHALRASLAHLWFETLHPVEDGNGRLGRAVFDLALALGATFHSKRTSRLWAVSPVLLKHRKEYYAQLEAAQKGDLDITEWLRWSIASVEQASDDARVCIERVVQVAHFWTRHRETNMSPRQATSVGNGAGAKRPGEWLAYRQTCCTSDEGGASNGITRSRAPRGTRRDSKRPGRGRPQHALQRTVGCKGTLAAH